MNEAWRLTFTYDGEEYRLRTLRKLEKRLPSGRTPEAGGFGRAVELRGTGKAVLFRRGIDHLTQPTMEYPTGDPARPLARVPAPGRREVSVLVPQLPEALSVAIVESGPAAGSGRTKRTRGEGAGGRDLLVVGLPREGDAK